jgi:membrane peptidoglycan carboxypeptidase
MATVTPKARWRRWGRRLAGGTAFCTGIAAGAGVVYELHVSALQSWLFARYIARLTYTVEKGTTPGQPPTVTGPSDERLGYSRLGEFRTRLERAGFGVTEHTRLSPELARLMDWHVAPPFPEPTDEGLFVRGANGTTIYDARRVERAFRDFPDIPPLITQALLFIENKELLEAPDPRSNPAVEWDRLAKASLLYVGSKLGLPLTVEGGSTLAIQLEKFRHSPGGRTDSPQDKLRQMTSASLKAYRLGPDTSERRREIVVEYLNMVPLAAAPGYGEVFGLGNGLHAWFGLSFGEVCHALRSDVLGPEAVRAFKHVITLLAALPAPSLFLTRDRAALERRADAYVHLMAARGVLDPGFAAAVKEEKAEFIARAPEPPVPDFVQRKASTAIRARLAKLLGVSSFYELDLLRLEVDSTIDATLQAEVVEFFRSLAKPEFVMAKGLRDENLLRGVDASAVLYSLLIFERAEGRNLLRIQADNLDQPFDVNRGVKLELGSTAKLRTLAHYLEIVAELHGELASLDAEALRERAVVARDPLTKWAAETVAGAPSTDLAGLLDRAMDRRYSANPGETFFTGSGQHHFSNFDGKDNGRILTAREAFTRSVNLVFIRMMRDLVRYHQARLEYDADAVLDGSDVERRKAMLEEIGEAESVSQLRQAYERYRDLPLEEIVQRLLRRRAQSPRHLTILFRSWRVPELLGLDLAGWLGARGVKDLTPEKIARLTRAYSNPDFTISDYGYLLSLHPLDVWLTGELLRDPDMTWPEVIERSRDARRVSSGWLFKTRNRRAQDRRLRVRIEEEAFARLTPHWRRLGFPFERLVASYATSIGSSGDRPAALADLVGIILNDGVRLPDVMLQRLRFAAKTPYEVSFEPLPDVGEQVMHPEVARVLRESLTNVVEQGTARRLAGALKTRSGVPLTVGGKTGTGDNRFFGRDPTGKRVAIVNRTATFVFFIGDRHFGVLTAFVPGREAARASYTSALPVTLLRHLWPSISARMDES